MRGLAAAAASLPLGVATDSYKASHFDLYPPGTTLLEAYACFRSGFEVCVCLRCVCARKEGEK